MTYETVVPAIFLERPNRFIAHCLVEGQEVVAHVKNTGRCRELLLPGVGVYLQYHPAPTRKTDYSLIAVKRGERLINMDSQAPNKIFGEGVEAGIITLPGFGPVTGIRPEVKIDASRLDFLLSAGEERAYVEVKGVTLEEDGVALFPDAPTLRGIKHLEELATLAKGGVRAYIALIVQMEGVSHFTPNNRTQPAFGAALSAAKDAGVGILCYDCTVTPNTIRAKDPVPVVL